MNRILSVILVCVVMCTLFIGCAKQEDPTTAPNANPSTNPSTAPSTAPSTPDTTPDDPSNDVVAGNAALEVMENIWNAWEFEYKDYFMGGGMTTAVSGAPGELDITDTDTLLYQFYVPEANLSEVQAAASVMHGMNANVFTAAAFQVSDAAAFAATMQETLLNTQFVCGSPASLMVYTLGDNCVLYAFGDTENLDSFRTALQAAYGDAVSVFDGAMG